MMHFNFEHMQNLLEIALLPVELFDVTRRYLLLNQQ